MKKIRYLFLAMLLTSLCYVTVNAETSVNTYSAVSAYRYDNVEGYVEFSPCVGFDSANAEYEVEFWKVTNSDGTASLQDADGNQVINIGTKEFELISAKYGLFGAGTEISGYEYNEADPDSNYAHFEGVFDMYSKDGTKLLANITYYDRLKGSDIVLVKLQAGAYILYDTKTMAVLRNLSYDDIRVIDRKYVQVTKYGKYSWKNKVGLFDGTGELIIPAKYQSIDVRSNYIQAQDEDWNYFYYTHDGKLISNIEGSHNMISENYFVVTNSSSETKTLHHKEKGQICKLPSDVNYVSSVYEKGFIVASNADNLYGIIDFSGKWTTLPQYDNIYGLAEDNSEDNIYNYDYFVAKNSNGYALIDYKNSIKKDFSEKSISESAGAYRQDNAYFGFDKAGNIVNLSYAGKGIFKLSGTEKYVLCHNGYICSSEYESLKNCEKLIIAQLGGKTGLIDTNEKIIVPFNDWAIEAFSLGEGKKYFRTYIYDPDTYDRFYGIYDENGKELLPCEYLEINSSLYLINPDTGKYQTYYADEFSDKSYNRYVIQGKDEKYGFIDRDFNIIVEPKYDYIEFFYDDVAVVGMRQTFSDLDIAYQTTTFYGMVDLEGNEVLPCQYYKIVNGISRAIVFDYEVYNCDCYWRYPTRPSSWNVVDKKGIFTGRWVKIDVPEKYLINCLDRHSAGGEPFNKNGYAVVTWGRSHFFNDEGIYDHYNERIIIDKNGNYVSQPFWSGYVGTYINTKYDEGTFQEYDADSFYIRSGYVVFDELNSWQEWEYGDKVRYKGNGGYGFVDTTNQKIQVLYDGFDDSYSEADYYYKWKLVKVNGKTYYYVTTSQYGAYSKVLDENGNVVIDGSSTDIKRRYIQVDGVYTDNPLFSGGTLLDMDAVLSANYYNKSKSHSFKIRDYGKSKYDDNHIFDVQIGGVTGTTDKTGRVKITPNDSSFTEVKVTADGYLPLTVPSKFIQSYYNNYYMYKEDYSTNPVVHAVFYNKSNVYKPDSGTDVTYCASDISKECVITPIISTNGNNIASVKIVQGDKEVEVTNTAISNVEVKNNKTYGLWTGETESFKPGMQFSDIGTPIYLIITTKTGTETKVKLQLKPVEKTIEEVDIDMGDEISFNADDGENSLLGGMSLKYKLFDKLPTDFKLTPVGDGNFTFKATLGVESKDQDKAFETMEDYYKTQMRDSYNRGYDTDSKMKNFDNFFKKLADEEITSSDFLPSAEIGITCGLKLYGYFEGTYDLQDDNTYKMSVTTGGLSAKLNAGQEITRQTLIPGTAVPAYWKAGLEVGDVIDVKFLTEDGAIIPDSAENELYLEIKGGGGVGIVDAATVGASGEGKVAVICTIPFSKDTLEAVISGKINLFDYELGILSGTLWTINTPELELYPDFGVKETEEYSAQLSRAYTDNELIFNVESTELMGLDDGNLNVDHSLIADNTYTFTRPQIVKCDDGKLIATWIEDERSRESDADRTAVYYSVYENDSWTNPIVVDDDTTADFSPSLKKIGNDVYLIWTNASVNFDSGETDTAKIAKSLVTSVAKWNGNSFELLGSIDSYGVVLNDITIVDDIPVVVWVEASDGDMSQSTSVTALKSATYIDGEWTVNTLLENQKAIDGFSVTANEDKLSIYYSQDVDGDVTTIDDKEIFIYCDGVTTQITENNVADTKPITTQDNVFWYSDSKIAYKSFDNGLVNFIDANCMSDRFNVSNSGELITYVKDNDAGKQTIYAICNSDGIWGEPLELIKSEKIIVSHEMIVDENENVTIISNEVETSDSGFGKATLDLYKVSQFGDLSVDNLTYNEYSMNGEHLHVLCDLTNNGTKTITGIKAKFLDVDGKEIFETAQVLQILPGETVPCTIAAPISESSEVTVQVDAVNFEDADLSNNTGKLTVKLKDISLENVELVEIDNKYMITAMAFNRGIEDLENVVVSLRKDGENGEVIDSITINTISACDFENIEFIISGDYSNQVLYVVCEEIENENLYGNNTELVKIPDLSKMVIMGDVYADGVVNSKDAVKLSQYLAKWDVGLTDIEKKAADIVSDGYINSKDSIKLTQYLAKWNVTLD